MLKFYGAFAGVLMAVIVTGLFLPAWTAFILVPFFAGLGVYIQDYCEMHGVGRE